MFEKFKDFVSTIWGYLLFFLILFGVLLIITAFFKLGSEIVKAIFSVLEKYWYITAFCALFITYLTGKSIDKK